MIVPVYLVVGVPCAGKSWVCEQLTGQYEYVPHDEYIGQSYVVGIAERMRTATKPLLIETPFSMSQIVGPLERAGVVVTPVFIIENHKTLEDRYQAREGKPIISGHLTRQQTYAERAQETGAFFGTSRDVLRHLQQVSQ